MTSPVTKEPTNMTFGFIGMQFKLLKAEGPNISKAGKPDFVAVALDVGGDKFASYLGTPIEKNPFLGMRGLRLGLVVGGC